MEWSEGGRGEEGESSSFALGRKENSARTIVTYFT